MCTNGLPYAALSTNKLETKKQALSNNILLKSNIQCTYRDTSSVDYITILSIYNN